MPETRLHIFSLFATLLFASSLSAQSPLLRDPALSPDGQQLSFSYQGDIWTVGATGGEARRITIHESYESAPAWSPDGKQIAFQGNRYGNSDIFIIDAKGGNPQRMTVHSAGDLYPQWVSTDNGADILFNSSRLFRQVERESEVFRVSAKGGTPVRLLDATGWGPAPSPDGRYIAFMRGSCRSARQNYRGPANRDIWIYDTQQKKYHQITDFDGQDVMPRWDDRGFLYFLSARANGLYNLYRQAINGDGTPQGSPKALSEEATFGIRAFTVSGDGSYVVVESGAGLFALRPSQSTKLQPLSIDIVNDYRFDPIERKTFRNDADDYALSPNEKYIAFTVRGEVFVSPNDKEKSRSVAITDNPARDQEVGWLNDTTLLFLSDRTGNYELYLARSVDPDQTDLFKTFKRQIFQLTDSPEDETGFVIAPDGKQIAIRRGRGELILADIDASGNLDNQRNLLDGWATPGGISWSPDSRWLAYSITNLNFNQEVFIAAVDGSQDPVNISLHPRTDNSPVWSPDGSKLGFQSIRNNGDSDIWFVWLRKADWEKTQSDWEELDEEEDTPKKKDNEEEDQVPPIEIDFDDIHERLVQVTRLSGNERNLAISPDGETFYFTTNGGGRTSGGGKPSLMKVKWNGKDMETVKDDISLYSLQLGPKQKNFYFIKSGGSIQALGADNGKIEGRPFEAEMKINHPEERKQIFAEAWRALRDGFYDPEFHGNDWEALRVRYEPIALQASTAQDFRAIFNEMLGLLNASHMGMYGSNPEETQRERTGLLGVEVEPVSAGVKITRVLPGSPADKERSQLRVGETITGINGQAVSEVTNFYELLNGTADEQILLQVAGGTGTREVVIRPASSLRSELYESWVDQRKELTEQYSNGRLGYIHIEGMNWPSFERFERELMAAGNGKEGIVIDVRFNGGGWTTDMLMAVLNVRQHAYTIPRGAADDLDREHRSFKNYYPYGERLPLSAWTGPSIALCNSTSYSNAEIFSHAYKTLGIGTLVGEPTFGAVISTGGQGLIDGSYVRMPFRGWYVKATEKNMENGPAVPDVRVDNQPDSKANNEDPQLKKAVELLLEQIER
jgi:tricorn protease